jgi:ketosteroid isomerase-like protein
MSQENVECLRAYLEALDSEALSRGEVDWPYLADDATYTDQILPDHFGEVYRGREGIGRAAQVWLSPYEKHSIELERIIDAGDCVVSVHRFRARARHSGIEVDEPVAWLFTFSDGKVTRWQAYRSAGKALAAAERSE